MYIIMGHGGGSGSWRGEGYTRGLSCKGSGTRGRSEGEGPEGRHASWIIFLKNYQNHQLQICLKASYILRRNLSFCIQETLFLVSWWFLVFKKPCSLFHGGFLHSKNLVLCFLVVSSVQKTLFFVSWWFLVFKKPSSNKKPCSLFPGGF